MSIVSGMVHSERTAVVLLHKRFSSDLAYSVIISALSRIVRTLKSAYLTLQHMSKNHSPFSSQFITSNIPSILIAFLRFFTCTALGDADLRFSLIFVPKPMMMIGGGGLHEMRTYITNITNPNTWPMAWKRHHFLLAPIARQVWPHFVHAKSR
jgi:hypothetical protein